MADDHEGGEVGAATGGRTTAAERRRAGPRERVLRAGRISFDSHALDCVVTDLSPSGARVLLKPGTGTPSIPETVTLGLRDAPARPARRRWLRGAEAGFEFVDARVGAAAAPLADVAPAPDEAPPAEAPYVPLGLGPSS